jgi:peptide deformylase
MSEILTFNTEENVPDKTIYQPKILGLVSEDDPFLRQVLPEFDFNNPPVDPMQFASQLVETCKSLRGLGLSANQCGYPYRVFVMGNNDNFVAFFNPKIVYSTPETVHMMEGCLSFPMLGLMITRPEEVHVEYQDYTGEQKEATFIGLTARCFQHELDHMNGILYTDLAGPLALKRGFSKRNKFKKSITKEMRRST